jgi:murein DD-endopeptidase MepM/ murein hydrolase activator NlpD
MFRLAVAMVLLFVPVSAAAAPAFEISDFYAPRADLVPGYYACRSGLDFDSFIFTFDLAADGQYALRGVDGVGTMVMSPADGTIDFHSGPFMPDETAVTYARNTTRLSDGNPVIIIRYDYGTVVTDDYCAFVE